MRKSKFTPIDKCLICFAKLTEANTNFQQDLCDECHHEESKELASDSDDDDWSDIGI